MRTAFEMMPHADAVGTEEFSRVMDSVTGTTASTDNRVKLLTNGDEAFPAMLAAIEGAKKRISMEMYIIRMDSVGRRFVEALSNAAKRGVKVRFLYDALGSRTIGDGDLEALYAAGAEFRVFNPFINWTLVRLNNRNHRKILVVDGRIAFLGGLNLAEDYDGDGTNGWRDSAIMVEGPAALEAERIFEVSWILGGWGFLGKDLPIVGLYHFKGAIDDTLLWLFGQRGTFCIPEHAAIGNGASPVRVVSSAPDRISSPILDMYLLAVNSARKFISITNGYFTPPWVLRRALVNAAKRGVRVRLILQGPTDVPTARTKIVGYYGALLKHGVEIYEWTRSVLHAKTMVVDGIWATVGSANLNRRGFFLNYEANVAVINPQFAAAMERQFEKDLQHCCRVTLEKWKRRSFKQKALEILLMPFAGQF
ncbi:MAG: phosphatidylserine/phosphatidylglycerophosphate/cardiolipin synthase family protein [Deltaproteobacteria bacterium]|nr:MAG: phosphatidylserine/phosphatidylglycerophosphate/cardiolipin synthase family protein [Deltaproteobacteria bacterium]